VYIKKIFFQSGVYGIGVLFTSLVSFMLLPLYTRYLSIKEFGEFSLILSAIFFFQYLFNMGVYSGFLLRYFDLDNAESQKRLISTVMVFYLVFLLCAGILIVIFNAPLSVLIIGRADILVLFCALMIAVFETMFTLPMLILRIKESAFTFVLINITKSIGVFASVFFALKILNSGIAGALFAQMTAGGVVTLLAYMLTHKQYMFYFDAKELWVSFKLGFPILIVMIAFWFIDYSNRFIVNHYLALENLAVYSLGFKVGQIILFLVTTFQTVWQPLMFKVFKEREAKRLFSDIFRYLVPVFVLAAFAISIFSKELISLFSTSSYMQAAKIVVMTAVTYALFGLYYFLQTPLLLTKRLYTIAALSCFAALLNIVLSLLLVPVFNINGAIFSIFMTYLGLVIAIFIIAQRNYKIPYDYAGLVKVLLSVLIISILASSFTVEGTFNNIVYKTAVLSLFFVLLLAFRFFDKTEIEYIKSRMVNLR